ncbi:somatostatin receptor type 2 isoform X2 [Folsomia candida]|uniref:somatostatin receptor type 2 isoform X2 n=1 Tax=Folsomia candida TaxID=158441 RepID=UPI001604A9B3|nr:somatostatin receptor type 2 isoform X2 [Folsomia candida]
MNESHVLLPVDYHVHSHIQEMMANCSLSDPNSTYFHENCEPTGSGQPWWIHMIVQILYGIVCCVGLCGNSLVIYVVVRFSKMQTVTNLYIVNLAIADECFLVGIPFLMTTIGLGYWPFGNIVCKAYFTSTSINQITSSMFLLIMSADRYLAVCHPISAPKWRTPLIAKFTALTAWTLSALIMVPIYMYANTLEIDNKINCNIFWPSSETWTGESIFIVYSFIISFAVPLTLIMIFYVFVILKLKTVGPKRRPPPTPSNQNLPSSAATPTIALSADRKHSADPVPPPAPLVNHLTPQQASRARDRKRSHRKVTKLVLTVITVYFVCWAPYWATQLTLIFMPHDSNHSETMLTLFLLAGCFSYSNSTMNPILYAFLSDNFKKSFLKACTCAKGQFFGWRSPPPVEITQATTVEQSSPGRESVHAVGVVGGGGEEGKEVWDDLDLDLEDEGCLALGMDFQKDIPLVLLSQPQQQQNQHF